jgi:hypothetical protein
MLILLTISAPHGRSTTSGNYRDLGAPRCATAEIAGNYLK